jgi:NAD(P)-dependent dehydrogenase (short-subunit alcohol dehydrogenase family)
VDDLETDTKSYFTGVRKFSFSSFISSLTQPQRLQLIVNRPLKQHGQPEDVASVVSYLASKDAHFITGKFPSSVIDLM